MVLTTHLKQVTTITVALVDPIFADHTFPGGAVTSNSYIGASSDGEFISQWRKENEIMLHSIEPVCFFFWISHGRSINTGKSWDLPSKLEKEPQNNQTII